MGVMAVCAQPQDKVDEIMKKCELKFKVSANLICFNQEYITALL